jgi:hypothetical protein
LNGLVAPPTNGVGSYDREQKRRHGSVCQLESE